MRRKRSRIDEMKRPTEHKTVQARILGYAQEMDWTYVPRAEVERQRGLGTRGSTAARSTQDSPVEPRPL